MEQVTLSIEFLFGILLGIFVPLLLWAWKMFSMTKRIEKMHEEPDEHGFGTVYTNQLLAEHMEKETESHRESISATKSLAYAIKELAHYIQWMGAQTTGKTPPPPVIPREG